MATPFRIQFPKLNLPGNYGGKPAIVLFSLSQPGNPLMAFATCIDIDGSVYQHVPLSVAELRAAAQKPCQLLEVSDAGGPTAGPRLVV